MESAEINQVKSAHGTVDWKWKGAFYNCRSHAAPSTGFGRLEHSEDKASFPNNIQKNTNFSERFRNGFGKNQ